MDHLRFPVLSSRLYIVFDTVDTCTVDTYTVDTCTVDTCTVDTCTVDKKTCNVDNLLRKLNDIVQLIIFQLV